MLSNTDPKRIFNFFEQICRIPHESGNEKALSDYIVKFAQERKFWVHQDSENNVLIRKPGSLGYENSPTITLQAHLDMVCEKNKETVFNFDTDPLKIYIDGDFIKAKGTTLGADNGIGVAIGMALLDSTDINHPPLEILLTTGEEIGLIGAKAFDGSLLKGKTLINIDSEEEGEFCVSCAGGLRALLSIPIEYIGVPEGFESYLLCVRGLKGGHSGADIDKERANSNRLMGRICRDLFKKFNLYLAGIEGGSKENAIPREADSILLIDKADYEELQNEIEEINIKFRNEYRVSDPDILVEIKKADVFPDKVYSKETSAKVITAINLLPNGIYNMSMDFPGLPETSNNIGVISKHNNEIEIVNAVRSSVVSRKYYLLEQIEELARLLGASVVTRGDYPAWEYSPNSAIRELLSTTYLKMYGNKAKIQATHGGLECGLFGDKVENIDLISIGPDIFNPHTPEESLSISSTARVWEFLLEVLAQLH